MRLGGKLRSAARNGRSAPAFGYCVELLARGMPWPRFIPELSVRQIYDTAEAHYRPKPLSGAAVVLVRAQTGEGGDTPYREIYADETLGWGAVTNNTRRRRR